MSNILRGLNEGYFSRSERDQQNAMNARRSSDLSRERNAGLNEPDEFSSEPVQTRNGVYEYTVPAGQEDIAQELGLQQHRGHWVSRIPIQRANFQFGRPQFHEIPSQGVAEGPEQRWRVTVGNKSGTLSHTKVFTGTREQAIKQAVRRFATTRDPVVHAELVEQGVAEGLMSKKQLQAQQAQINHLIRQGYELDPKDNKWRKPKDGNTEPKKKEQGVAEAATPASTSKILRLIQRHHSDWFDTYGIGEVEDAVVDMGEMGQFQGMSAEDAVALVAQELDSLYGAQGMNESQDVESIREKIASLQRDLKAVTGSYPGDDRNRSLIRSEIFRAKEELKAARSKKQAVAEGSSLGYTVIVRGNDFSYSRLKDALSDGHPSPAKVYKNGKFLGTIGSLSNQGVAEGKEELELYGLRVGDTVRAVVNGKRVQGDVIDIFPETMEVELLLRGANAGRTITVDVRDTESLNELSNNTLASYKKKAGADATQADKRGDYARGNKRMSGIIKATKKEFDNDAKGVAENYPKHQDLSGISTEKLKAYLAKQGQQQSPGEGNQVKRVRAELQRRSQGVAEAGNKPLEKSRFSTGDTRTPRDIKSQMQGASDEFVKSTADSKTGPFHSKVAKMQGKLAKSELRRREQGVAEEKQRLDPKCWKGYKKQGTKMKGDTRVNNCVPVKKESAIMKGLVDEDRQGDK